MLIDVYEQVLESPRLSGIPQELGDGRELSAPLSAPRIVWVMDQGENAPPDTIGYVADVLEGQRVMETSHATVRRGAELHLFTPYTLPGLRQMERLILDLRNALRDVLLVDGNYKVGTERWIRADQTDRRDVWEVVLPVRVYVPIYDAAPAQLPQRGAVVTPAPAKGTA